jgi:hypothetical protein
VCVYARARRAVIHDDVTGALKRLLKLIRRERVEGETGGEGTRRGCDGDGAFSRNIIGKRDRWAGI